ncbi:MAG: hypothetical protein DMF78_16005 [Acidobacteria bacterium]|nr:MAG: hypothetical protein DMF78_16005 [Acidobacteriota bacterium]
MTALQRAFVVAVLAGGLVTLAGLFHRQRSRECWSYVAYLIALVSWGCCLAAWPGRFYRWDWWMAKQSVLDALKVFVALELAYRAVRAFPGARARLQMAMLTVLVLSAAIIAGGPSHRTFDTLWQWQPQILTATIWIFGVTALCVVFYRLPVSDWHRVLVLAFTAKLFLTTVLLNMLGHFGWSVRPWFNVIDGTVDVAVSWTLAYAAWRPVQQDVLSPALRQRIAEAAAAATATA